MVSIRKISDLEQNGEVFLSNAISNKNYLLRACIVNFRTSKRYQRDFRQRCQRRRKVASGASICFLIGLNSNAGSANNSKSYVEL